MFLYCVKQNAHEDVAFGGEDYIGHDEPTAVNFQLCLVALFT